MAIFGNIFENFNESNHQKESLVSGMEDKVGQELNEWLLIVSGVAHSFGEFLDGGFIEVVEEEGSGILFEEVLVEIWVIDEVGDGLFGRQGVDSRHFE